MSPDESSASEKPIAQKPSDSPSLWRNLGPGVITAAVVIGPGTITVASKIGAAAGMALVWALTLSASFMMVYTALAARIGILNRASILTLVTTYYGRWLGVTIGLLAFAVCAGFQSSNYLACSTAMQTLTGISEPIWMAIIGVLGLVFVFGARALYRALERVMTALVAVMVVAFVINLVVAGPSVLELIRGLVPSAWPPELTGLMIAMSATTFSVIAALYQSTLVQQKGWTEKNLSIGIREAVLGIGVLFTVSLMIMWTAATELKGSEIANASDLSSQLRPLLGNVAVFLFSMGFLAAGFSSTVINAMIGGGLLADGLGFSANINQKPARIATAIAMAVGLIAGYYLLHSGSALGGIVIAQKSTILTVPLVAVVMLLMANDTRIVGERKNRLWQNVWAGVALLTLIAMSVHRLREMFGG